MRVITAVPAALLTAGLLAGCSGANVPGMPGAADPKEAVRAAFDKSGEAKEAAVTFKLDTTEDDLNKLMEATGETDSADQAKIVTKLLPKVSYTMALRSQDTPLKDVKDYTKLDLGMNVAVDGKPVDIRWIDQRFFAMADVAGLADATDLFTMTQVEQAATQLIPQMPWVKTVIEGKWVEADAATMKTLAEKASEELTGASAAPTVDQKKAQDAFFEASKVTKNGNTYEIATDAKQLLKIFAAASDTDDFTDAKAEEAAAKINDGADLNLAVELDGDNLKKVTIDVADVLRTWPKAEGDDKAEIEKMAATEFNMKAVIEMSDPGDLLKAPQPEATIPAKDLEMFTR